MIHTWRLKPTIYKHLPSVSLTHKVYVMLITSQSIGNDVMDITLRDATTERHARDKPLDFGFIHSDIRGRLIKKTGC